MWWMGLALGGEVSAVVVGSGVYWRPDCEAAVPECMDASRTLGFADDDVWKAAFLLRPTVGERMRVLATPDDSTAGMSVHGEPSRTRVGAAIRDLARDPETTEIVVYVAAHGSPGEIHLADGRHRFADVRSEWLEAAGDKQLVLLADACHSASWRGGPMARGIRPGRYPPVMPSTHGMVEAVVVGGTPEDAQLEGGVFSYVLFSGWAGGADRDRDGDIDAPELSDFVHAYASVADPSFNPRLRSPADSPFRALPTLEGTPLELPTGEPARWVVQHASGRWLMDLFSLDSGSVTVRLPDGGYTLWQLHLESADKGWTSADYARPHAVTIEGGEVRWRDPGGVQETADTGAVRMRGIVGNGLTAVGRVQRRPKLARDWLMLGTGASGGWLPTNRWTTDIVAGWSRVGPRRLSPWVQLSLGAALVQEPRVNMGRALLGGELRMAQRGVVKLSGRVGLGAEWFRLPRLSMVGAGPTAEAKVRVDVLDQRWGVFAELGGGTALHRTVRDEWVDDAWRTVGHAGFQWVL